MIIMMMIMIKTLIMMREKENIVHCLNGCVSVSLSLSLPLTRYGCRVVYNKYIHMSGIRLWNAIMTNFRYLYIFVFFPFLAHNLIIQKTNERIEKRVMYIFIYGYVCVLDGIYKQENQATDQETKIWINSIVRQFLQIIRMKFCFSYFRFFFLSLGPPRKSR